MSATRRRNITPFDGQLVVALAVLAGIAGAMAPGAPTGIGVVDGLLQAVLAALVTLAGSRARRWAVLVVAAAATATAVGLVLVPALVALVLALALAARRRRLRLLSALASALAVQALLRQDPYLFHGASVLVGCAVVIPLLVSAHRLSRSRVRRRTRRVVGALAAVVGVAVVAAGVAVALSAPHLRDGGRSARAALTSARAGDTVAAEGHLARSAESFRAARRYNAWTQPARLVPVVAQHLEAMHVVSAEGETIAEAGGSVARVGDYEDLRYESGRIDLDRIRILADPLDEASEVLGAARHRLDGLDRSWLVGPFAKELADLRGEVERASDEASAAARAVAVAPGLLGADGPRTYFLAFVNPAEERGGGGFLGAYGELRAVDGELELTRSGSISELIFARRRGERRLDGPDEYLERYGSFSPADYFQDVTFSPHFPYTADVIGQLYPQSGGSEVDGVISIDPRALEALLSFTGPIEVAGYPEPLTTENASRILLRDQYLLFDDSTERRDLLVDASEVTFDALTTGSLPGPEQLVRVLGPMVAEGRVQVAAADPDEQAFFEGIGADGAMPSPDGGDVFMVAHQNFGNSKIDAYLGRSVDYQAVVDPQDGTVAATATITLDNRAPARAMPRAVIGNNRDAPDGTNLMLFSVYSALDLTGAEIDGEPLTMARQTEAGLFVYSARLDVAPRSTRVVTLTLEGGLDMADGTYRLHVRPQPMVIPDEITIGVSLAGDWQFGDGEQSVLSVDDRAAPGQPVEVTEQVRRDG